ncbi:collagen alpha-1(III) chain-like [Ovis canadensis]|uniref:collagen alpha-1(III) chain-like n=1 Tax=Ovis canadensis TaxID=37174 RepID=UPI003752F835
MPGAAAAVPAPARPGRRRLSRPNDDAAARLPPLPPRCECRPARARGAHTPAGWRALTHARTPPKAPPPPPPPLAQGVGGGGERGGGGRGRRAGRRPITSAGSRRLQSQVFTPGKKKVKGKRPGTRRERGYERVGTRAPEKEKRRQREARRAPGETPERGLGPARTPRREEGPAGDRPLRPAPRCPGSPAGFRRPHAPGERAGKETETQKGGRTSARKLVSGGDSITDTPWNTHLAIPETPLPASYFPCSSLSEEHGRAGGALGERSSRLGLRLQRSILLRPRTGSPAKERHQLSESADRSCPALGATRGQKIKPPPLSPLMLRGYTLSWQEWRAGGREGHAVTLPSPAAGKDLVSRQLGIERLGPAWVSLSPDFPVEGSRVSDSAAEAEAGGSAARAGLYGNGPRSRRARRRFILGPGARPESAKCAGRRAEAGACAGRRCLPGITARDSCPQTAPVRGCPAVPSQALAAPAALRGLQTCAPPGHHGPRLELPESRAAQRPPPLARIPALRTALTSRGAGREREASSRRLPLECAGRGERAPLRLFPETPPGGVRPAGPSRRGTPAATLLPSPPRAEHGRSPPPLGAPPSPLQRSGARSSGGQDGR